MRRLLMFIVSLAGVMVVCLAHVDGAGPARKTDPVHPQWQVGDQWTVETETRQLHRATPRKARVTARWRFVVRGVEKVDGAPCFRIVVRPANAKEPKTVVWIDRERKVIRRVDTQLPSPQGYRTVTESYRSSQAAPVVGPGTALPIALPRFPEAGIKSLNTYLYETICGPAGIKAAGEIGFSTKIRQDVSRPSPERMKLLFNDEHVKSLRKRDLVEVKLTTPDETVRQVWAADTPWPVLSDNGLTKARLVEAKAAKDAACPSSHQPADEAAAVPHCRDEGNGVKQLETGPNFERGGSSYRPWSGYWWPIRQGRLLVPLAKYDRLTGAQTAAWERRQNPPGRDIPEWHGYCHASAAAAVLETEPVVAHMFQVSGNRLTLDVGDQKGLLTACHAEDLANSWGDRYGDGFGSEDRQDLRPDRLWRLLKRHLGQQSVPLILDVESGEAVWNYPVYQYEIRYKAVDDGAYTAALTLLMADNAVRPAYQGTKARKQTYRFRFQMRGRAVVAGSGQWIGRSREDHPDFAWYPLKAVATNPELTYGTVKKLVEAGQVDPPASSEGDHPSPPTDEPGTSPTPEPTGVAADQGASGTPADTLQGHEVNDPVVLSPMELVALIANKTSAFKFDAQLDRISGASYYPGETFFVRVRSDKPGYLYLLQLDTTGTPALLYPTRGEDNQIGAGKLVPIRPAGRPVGFPVTGPAGTVRVKAVVTSRPVAFSGTWNGFQAQGTATPAQTAQQAPRRGDRQASQQLIGQQDQRQTKPVQFRFHPTQRQQIQRILSRQELPANTQQIGCSPPQRILGPFAQDMMMFYVDTGPATPENQEPKNNN